ncbi:hypothetical protein BJ170DRAFT_688422 [Xylariales sp. AK1849]|nr:hypothetical protein BJ170DRAFT_688422 [Xylariales sp. AK1849]
MTHAMILGNSGANNDPINGFVPPVGSATVQSGSDWAQQAFTLTLSCQYDRFASEVLSDGSLNFRMFLRGYAASSSLGSFTWYIDEIRVQQLTPPSGGTYSYLTNTCKVTPPASTTSSAAATPTYTITQTYAPTATPAAGTNALSNPSFESITVTDYNTDVVGGATKATVWTYTRCQSKQCSLHDGMTSTPTCQDERECEYWLAGTTYSQTIDVDVGSTYFLSLWTLLQNAPAAKTGGSLVEMTIEPAGATAGSGGVVLTVTVDANQDWTQCSQMLELDAASAQQFCGAAAGDTGASCQVTVVTGYTGSWSTSDGVGNYFDNVGFLLVES